MSDRYKIYTKNGKFVLSMKDEYLITEWFDLPYNPWRAEMVIKRGNEQMTAREFVAIHGRNAEREMA